MNVAAPRGGRARWRGAGMPTLGDHFVSSQGEHVTAWSGDFGGRHGSSTLTVDELQEVETGAPSRSIGSPDQARISGPWTFTFSVP